MSITITLNGNSSVLTANFFPPINLSKDYVCGLIDFQTFHTIPNVDEGNNLLHLKGTVIKLPFGKYTAEEIVKFLEKEFKNDDINIKFEYSKTKRRYVITTNVEIDFTQDKSIAAILGFSKRILSRPKHIALGETFSHDGDFFNTFDGLFYINEDVHLFHLNGTTIELPVGAYELDEIGSYVKSILYDIDPKINIDIIGNEHTLKSEIITNRAIDFTQPNSIGSLLGFQKRILDKPYEMLGKDVIKHESDSPLKITNLNLIRLDCNITTQSYINEEAGHILHEFSPDVPPGYKIIEIPRNVIYLPINTREIYNITVRVLDQSGSLLNLRGETVTLRLHLKPIDQ